jgi:hypothetical protein
MTRDGLSSPGRRSPGDAVIGSQTNVTLVLPFSARDVPTHILVVRPRAGSESVVSAVAIAAGVSGFGGAFARAASSAV